MDVRTALYYLGLPCNALLSVCKGIEGKVRERSRLASLRKRWKARSTVSRECPLCMEREPEVFTEEDRHGLGVCTVICRSCGFVYTNPQGDAEFYADFYRRHYWALYFGRGGTPEMHLNHWRGQASTLIDTWEKCGIDLEGKKVFEIGPGLGYTLETVEARWSCQLAGLEPSVDCVRRLKERFPAGQFVEATIENHSRNEGEWQAGGYDFVYSTHVFEHVFHLREAFQLFASLLRSDGVGYLEVPDLEYAGWKFPHMFHIAHLWHFSEDSLAFMCGEHGLKVVQVIRGADSCIKRSGIGFFLEKGGGQRDLPRDYEVNRRRLSEIRDTQRR